MLLTFHYKRLAIILLFCAYLNFSKTAPECPVNSECIEFHYCEGRSNLLRPPSTYWKRETLRKLFCGVKNDKIMICCRENEIDASIGENLLPTSCGQPVTNRQFLEDGRATMGSHPWMALLGSPARRRKNETVFLCGGALINDRYVLSAAHCITYNLNVIRLGEYDLDKETDCETLGGRIMCSNKVLDLAPEKVIAHPSYGRRLLYPRNALRPDIALIRLNETVIQTPFVMPICLPFPGENILQEMQSQAPIVAGYGGTNDEPRGSAVLLQARLRHFPFEQCRQNYHNISTFSIQLDQLYQICLGGEHQRGTCKGDSGAPAILRRNSNDNQFVLVGILSLGHPIRCGLENYPDVFTNVTYARSWIIANLRP